jgi:hypothetical protein
MTSERKRRQSLPGYFKGLSDRLKQQVESMTPVIVHSGEMGDNDHGWFADLLRQYLPQKYGVDTGFVVNKDSDKGSADFFAAGKEPRSQDPYISSQIDILLLDVLHNAPFCSEKSFKVCPIEMVLGAVEVTRFLDACKLREDCNKLSKIKELARRKAYVGNHAYLWAGSAITSVVGLASNLSWETIQEVHTSFERHLRPDMIFLLDKALYYYHEPGDRLVTIVEDRLYHFIALLRHSMDRLPVDSADLLEYLPLPVDD